MDAISLDKHAHTAIKVVALRAERSRINAELAKAEADLRAVIGDAQEATLGGEVLFAWTQGPEKTKTDTDALIASLSPRTVARFAVTVPGSKSLRLVTNAADVVARFATGGTDAGKAAGSA